MGKIFNGEFASALLNDKKYKQEKRDEKYSLSKKSKTNDNDSSNSSSKKPSAIRLDKNERTKTRKFGKALTSSGKFRKSDGYFKKKNKLQMQSEFAH